MPGNDVTRTPIRVLLADDQADFRMLLRRWLERDGRFEVVAEAASATEAVDQVRDAAPDVVLVDLRLQGLTDERLILQLAAEAPQCMVAVLSARSPEDEEAAARRSGAFAFYEKSMVGEGLLAFLGDDYGLFQRALAGEDVVAPTAISRR